MNRSVPITLLVAAVSASALAAPQLFAKKSSKPTDLARELAALRSQVESISNRIQAEQETRRSQVRSLTAQQTEVDMELRREKLKVTQLRDKLAKEKARLAKASKAQAALGPAVNKAIATFKTAVAQTMPYRLDERLASLDELTGKLKAKTTTPAKAFTRLWEMIEDELRLGRESALDRQVIQTPDGEVLADVIKIGMVGMLYQTSEDSVGRLVRKGDTYTWEKATDEVEVQQIAGLFDAFRKKIRVGYFSLPAALVARFADGKGDATKKESDQ